MQNFKFFSFSVQLSMRHYKTKYGINSVFQKKIQRKKITSNKRKKEKKKIPHPQIYSREVLEIE